MIQDIIKKQQEYFRTDATKDVEFRKAQLSALKTAIKKYEKDITAALNMDLGKHEFESYVTEVGFVLDSITYFLKHIKRWSRDKHVKTPIHQPLSRSFVRHEPHGNVLLIGPFNYPFQLIIEPLIGAIAAGNTVIIKPSEIAVNTQNIVKKLIEETFDEKYIAVITGGIPVTQELINSEVDYIFFTGSERVGRIVMEAAAKRLIPVTLELGGKSPVIVDSSANIKVAANRIVWGKFINTGQTCIAPDYVYVHRDVEKQLIEAIRVTIDSFYGRDTKVSVDYGKIITPNHFNRLTGLIDQNKVCIGGDWDEEHLHISPTVMCGVNWQDSIMQEEIFGPILPILSYDDAGAVIDEVKQRPKPLACYVFSEDKSFQNRILNSLSFGGGCINDTISHVASPHMPFGGVGNSGIGGYHGVDSFITFSNAKSILKKSTLLDLPLAYPPYGDKLRWIRKIMGR